jgi:hypothetical protein
VPSHFSPSARLLGRWFLFLWLFGFLLLTLVVIRICVFGVLLFCPRPGFSRPLRFSALAFFRFRLILGMRGSVICPILCRLVAACFSRPAGFIQLFFGRLAWELVPDVWLLL